MHICRFAPVFLLLQLFAAQAQGQLCGYDFQNLFIIDIREGDQPRQAKNIKVYLMDENLIHRFRWSSKKNEEVKIEIVPNGQLLTPGPAGRKEFPRAGDYYVVTISNQVPRNELPPVYIAMVVQGSKVSYHRLPYEKSLGICENHPYSDNAVYQDKPMVQQNREPFSPIRIDLSRKEDDVRPVYPLDKLFFKFNYAQRQPDLPGETPSGSDFTMLGAEVFDYHSLKSIQSISPAEAFYFGLKDAKQYVVQTDVFGDNPPGIRDLMITTRMTISKNNEWADTYRDFYLFNERQQQYVRWTSLSEFPNVSLGEDGWPIRHENENTLTHKLTRHFKFDGEKWKHHRTDSVKLMIPVLHPVHPPSPEVQPSYLNCVTLIGGNEVLLPIQKVAENQTWITMRDTLSLTNHCNITMALQPLGQSSTYFNYPKAVGPGRAGKAVFSKTESVSPGQVQLFEHFGAVQTSGGQFVSTYLRYFAAGARTAVTSPESDLITKFRGQGENPYTVLDVEVDTNLLPTGYGPVFLKSENRVGQWLFFSSEGKIASSTIYSKGFYITFANAEEGWDQALPEIHENGHWAVPDYMPNYNGYYLHCTAATDSIRLKHNGKTAACRYEFNNSNNNSGGELHFLSPGEQFLRLGAVHIPLAYPGYRYVVTWNYEKIEPQGNFPIDVAKTLQELKAKYKEITFSIFQSWLDCYEINLDHLTELQREKILASLQSEPHIKAMSRVVQLGKRGETYSAPTLTVEFKNETMLKQCLALLQKHGFQQVPYSNMAGRTFEAAYHSNLVDTDFYHAINALATEAEVNMASPHFYFAHHPESGVGEAEH